MADIIEEPFVSSSTGARYVLSISIPARHDRSTGDYPLIVVLDARWTFGTVSDAVMSMAMAGEVPEAVIVGVGYPEPSLKDLVQRRAIDYTPTATAAPPDTGVTLAADELGGASRFLDLLLDEILPPLGDRFRLSGDRTIVGHSFSALFALRTLLCRPQAFDRYLLASPSIWWDGRAILDIEEHEAKTRVDMAARVFVSVGTAEMEGTPFTMAANVDRLVTTLRARDYPGLELEHRRLAGETHHSTIGAAVSAGLRWLHLDGSI